MNLSFEKVNLPAGLSNRYAKIALRPVGSIAGFDIFDFYSGSSKVSIGDDADFLQLFMILAGSVPADLDIAAEPLILASDARGNRLFAKQFTLAEKEKFRYGYIALSAAGKEIPEKEINQSFGFFAEVSKESAKRDGFEKEARKIARVIPTESKAAWERIITEKLDFIKTDLYAFHLLKLYSWGFQIVSPDGPLDNDIHLVRPKPGKPRGASRK